MKSLRRDRWKAIPLFAVFLVVGLLLYGHGLTNAFVTLDDDMLITLNTVVHELSPPLHRTRFYDVRPRAVHPAHPRRLSNLVPLLRVAARGVSPTQSPPPRCQRAVGIPFHPRTLGPAWGGTDDCAAFPGASSSCGSRDVGLCDQGCAVLVFPLTVAVFLHALPPERVEKISPLEHGGVWCGVTLQSLDHHPAHPLAVD